MDFSVNDWMDCINARVMLPNRKMIDISFATWDSILDVKRSIFPFLTQNIADIQQISCIVCGDYQQFEVHDNTLLKYFWNNQIINMTVRIEHVAEEVILYVPKLKSKVLQKLYEYSNPDKMHSEHGNLLDTNAIKRKDPTGYRNKITDKLYRNIITQTESIITINDYNNTHQISNKSQTVTNKDMCTQVCIDNVTQTGTLDISMSPYPLEEIMARKFVSHESTRPIEIYHKYAKTIQQATRIWIRRSKFERMLSYYHYLLNLIKEEEKYVQNQANTNEQIMMLNFKYPTKVKDFEALYSAINDNFCKSKSALKHRMPVFAKAEGKRLLEIELQCLKEIDKQRKKADEISDERKTLKQLDYISKPVIITSKLNGKPISIENQMTCNAKQLKKYYIALKRRNYDKQERIRLLKDLIDTLKTIEEIDLTGPIISLLVRELDMLTILQLKNSDLQILRKRTEITFKSILNKPEIIPAINQKPKASDYFKCFNCRHLKPIEKFVVNTNLKNVTTCKDCSHLKRIGTERINVMPYEIMLKYLKTKEAELCATSSLVFLISVKDIYYLAKVIWKGKSAISESTNLANLRLTRWLNDEDWSPSNTILLTIKEAYDHSKINDLSKTYTFNFIKRVYINHLIEDKYFKNLTAKSLECDQKIWKDVKIPQILHK